MIKLLNTLDNKTLESIHALAEEHCKESGLGYTTTYDSVTRTAMRYVYSAESDVIVYIKDDKFIGYANVYYTQEGVVEKTGMLSNIYVLPEYRRSPAGIALFKACLQWFEDKECFDVLIGAHSECEAVKAIHKLAERFGFKPIGETYRRLL